MFDVKVVDIFEYDMYFLYKIWGWVLDKVLGFSIKYLRATSNDLDVHHIRLNI